MEFSALLPIRLGERSPDVLARVLDAWEKVEDPGAGFELVLCCDGPDARVEPLVSGRPYRVRLLQQAAAGQSTATNRAASASRGRTLLFSAQDVIPDPQLLCAHARAQRAHPGAAILGALPYPEELPVTRFMHFLIHGGPQFAYDQLRNDAPVRPYRLYAPNFSLARERFRRVGGFRESLPYGCQDSDLGLRLYASGVTCIYREDAVGYHWHPQTLAGYAERQLRCGRSLVQLHRLHPDHGDLRRLSETAIDAYWNARGKIAAWTEQALALEQEPESECARAFFEIPDSPFGGSAFVPALPFLYDRITRFHLHRGVHAQLCEDEGSDGWMMRRPPGAEILEGRSIRMLRLPKEHTNDVR